MLVSAPINPIDYLVIGHLTCDLTPQGCFLGGTAAYSALTAKALGLRPGILTSNRPDFSTELLEDITIVNLPADQDTTFENIEKTQGRVQVISSQAEKLGYQNIPESWRSAPIIHLAPVAQEVEPSIIRSLTNPLIGLTIQGWLRDWDTEGNVYPTEWPEAPYVLQQAGAVVLSIEDVRNNDQIIEEFASYCPVLAVTEGSEGVRLYWHGDVRRFKPPERTVVDTIGSGDIFATAFFVRLYTTKDPWEAARFAVEIASYSVTRKGLESIPTKDEIENCLTEVF